MGRLTEHLRSDEVRKGRAYELQGSDACCSESPASVTNDVAQVNLSATGEHAKIGSGLSPGALKSRGGEDKV